MNQHARTNTLNRAVFAIIVLAAVTVPFSFAGAEEEVSELNTIVIPWSPEGYPADALTPPAGTVLKLEAPPAWESDAAAAERQEIVRSQMGEAPDSAGAEAELIIPYTDGPLPPEALSPPPGTRVLLMAPQPVD